MANHQHTHVPPVPPPPPPPAPPMPSHSTRSDELKEQEKPGDGIPYIGSRISLISKTDIRYEGYLFNIDTRQSMVALQNVRSFGTEGRRSDHIPPSDTILPFATFKASEIKDLHVCEAARSHSSMPFEENPSSAQYTDDSQIRDSGAIPTTNSSNAISSRQGISQNSTSTLLDSSPPKNVTSAVKSTLLTPEAANAAAKSTTERPKNTSHASRSTSSGNMRSVRTIPGMGGHLLKRKERRVPGEDKSKTISNMDEFNFEQALTGFDKEKEFEKLTVDDKAGSYQKSSFFDTISCDALDRLEGNKGRISASDERKLNTETFGAVGLNNGRRNYRGGRGRGYRGGRGGRGRHSGRGWNSSNRDGRHGYRRYQHHNEDAST